MCCSQAWRGFFGFLLDGRGEYVSVRSQRELYEQQLELERQELESSPEEEQEELALIYQAKGIPEREAPMLARRIIENPKTAIDTLAREELGLDPTQLGSPWSAAASSFVAFIVGALVGAPLSIRCRAIGVDRQRVVQLPCAVRSRSPAFDLYRPWSAAERSQDAGDRIAGLRNYLHGRLAARGVRCRLRAKPSFTRLRSVRLLVL